MRPFRPASFTTSIVTCDEIEKTGLGAQRGVVVLEEEVVPLHLEQKTGARFGNFLEFAKAGSDDECRCHFGIGEVGNLSDVPKRLTSVQQDLRAIFALLMKEC